MPSCSDPTQATRCTMVYPAAPSARGAVFTRPEVAEFILDLVGYTPDRPLHQQRILEPSFGDGVFLLAILRRLLSAARRFGASELSEAIRGVELHPETFEATYNAVVALLQQEGFSQHLADRWLIQGDYLLCSLEGPFHYVVGNPPYVRLEAIPPTLLAEYKKRYATMYNRADLYIPFIERSLSLLAEGGTLGFICADRWTKNHYGARLRKYVADNFHLKIFLEMAHAPAFRSKVAAYPAIVVISREAPRTIPFGTEQAPCTERTIPFGTEQAPCTERTIPFGTEHTPHTESPTRIARLSSLEPGQLTQLAEVLRSRSLPEGSGVRVAQITRGAAPWLLLAPEQRALLERLERRFPSLEEAGCRVGIGVATGADQAFIGVFEALEVEPDRKLPLVTTQDICSGEVRWGGQGLINPFSETGELVDLRCYPRLRAYLEARREVIAGRHYARRFPDRWYRTIDRIVPSLARTPKLLIPDIKGRPHVVLEEGCLYPHHNLYYITSESWDLRALQAVLLSAVAHLFVAAYSTQMRGGYLRFQAQYLRRIRIPPWSEVPPPIRQALLEAAQERDVQACNQATSRLYGLSEDVRLALVRLYADT
jgi:hypothetical protein